MCPAIERIVFHPRIHRIPVPEAAVIGVEYGSGVIVRFERSGQAVEIILRVLNKD
ncbi:hypothetical protein D3C84_1251670 [compost metagenome]